MRNENNPYGISLRFLLLLLITFGCEQEPGLLDQSADNAKEESEIALIERELGVKLYYRDLTLKDAKCENQVTLRVAAVEESTLDEYLKYRVFSIDPIYKKEEITGSTETSGVPKVLNPASHRAGDFESTVITEMISQNLSVGAIGVRLHNRYNDHYKIDKSGRTKYISLTTHTSNNWPSWVTYQSYNNTEMQLDYKMKWYSSWFPVYGPATWCCYDSWEFYVDGPYRVRIWVSYNLESDYYHSFIY